MPEWLRNTGIILILGVVVFCVFKLTTHARKLDFDDHVHRIGQKIATLLPDGEAKPVLDEYFANLQERAKNQEVEPEEVERVIASLLNAQQSGKTLTSEQTRALLNLAKIPKAPKPPAFPNAFRSEKPAKPEDWVALEERMDNVIAFNDLMDEKGKMLAPKAETPKGLRYFRYDDGLNITIDDTLKNVLGKLEFKDLAIEVKRLDDAHMLKWKDDLKAEMEANKEKAKAELERLKTEYHWEQHIEAEDHDHALRIVDAIKVLDSLQIVVPVPFDSVFKVVEKELVEHLKSEQKNKNKNKNK